MTSPRVQAKHFGAPSVFQPVALQFLLIGRAWRDEGTSHHYLPPGAFAEMPEPALIDQAAAALAAEAIRAPRAAGCLAVEMEAAALYAFATAARGG